MNDETIEEIIEGFNNDREFLDSNVVIDGGIDPLFARLHRAALDQLSDDKTMVSRYAIWANTVRDNIRQADTEIGLGNTREARRLLCRAANSLSAFVELQANMGRECE